MCLIYVKKTFKCVAKRLMGLQVILYLCISFSLTRAPSSGASSTNTWKKEEERKVGTTLLPSTLEGGCARDEKGFQFSYLLVLLHRTANLQRKKMADFFSRKYRVFFFSRKLSWILGNLTIL